MAINKFTHQRKINESGFTIIELLIATVIFSVVLLVLTESLLNITDTYYKGITQSNTQNDARNIVNSVAQAIEFNGGVPTPLAGNTAASGGYCIGNQLFSYLIGYELENNPSSDTALMQAPDGLVVSNVAGCSSETTAQDLLNNPPNLAAGSQELVSPNMRMASFSITPVDVVNNLYKVDVRVINGATDLLTTTSGSNANCVGGDGDQFCAVSELSAIVQMRVN